MNKLISLTGILPTLQMGYKISKEKKIQQRAIPWIKYSFVKLKHNAITQSCKSNSNYCNCGENIGTLLLIFPDANRVFSLHFDIVASLKPLKAACRLEIHSAYSDVA